MGPPFLPLPVQKSPLSPLPLQHRHRSWKTGSTGQPGRRCYHCCCCFCWEAPIAVIFAIFLAVRGLQTLHDQYLLPQLHLLQFTIPRDYTYYHRYCDARDLSTNDTMDLVVPADSTTAHAVDNIMTHGASIYPHLLQASTAANLRAYILEQNKVVPTFDHILKPDHRHTWGLQVDEHDSVVQALREIYSNALFRHSMFEIMGDDPAILEFNHITALYGAEAQDWHEDVTYGTPLRFARNYVPHYSLFIPLQNTTVGMGATGICPGSHMCGTGPMYYCHDHGFAVFAGYEHWPAGWGFVYNQQLVHRGGAHMDATAPDRVMLIMTLAPRPRYQRRTLETRFIAQGGADFIHWSSWGHTWYDFARPRARMLQPWRFLKSLGVFKAPSSAWGWDYVSQSSGRIANEQPGWNRVDYDDLFMAAGGLPNVPAALQGHANADTDTSDCWSEFAVDTLQRWIVFVQRLRWGLVAVYVVWTVTWNGPSTGGAHHQQQQRRWWAWRILPARMRPLPTRIVRLVILQVALYLMAAALERRVAQRSWGRHIKSGQLYQISPARLGGTYHGPATLPTPQDVLVTEDLQSDYLKAVTRMFDVGHPGNKQWRALVAGASTGYHNGWTEPLQTQLAHAMIIWSRQAQARILAKNVGNDWSALDSQRAVEFAHVELLMASHVVLHHVLRWIDYLLSETKYGYWRDTALHTYHVPALLRALHRRLARHPWSADRNGTTSRRVIPFHSQPSPRPLSAPFSRSSTPRKAWSIRSSMASLGLPPPSGEQPPYDGAWLQVGDIVDAKFASSTHDWFRATITGVSLEDGYWTVEYDDGDVDTDLCRRCVRPFREYGVGDTVQYLGLDGTTMTARVVQVHNNAAVERYDLFVPELDEDVYGVVRLQLHRHEPEEFRLEPGAMIQFQRGPHDYVHAGRIEERQHDDVFVVLDETSRRVDNVRAEWIYPDMEWYKMMDDGGR